MNSSTKIVPGDILVFNRDPLAEIFMSYLKPATKGIDNVPNVSQMVWDCVPQEYTNQMWHLSLELNFSWVEAMNLVSGISGQTICSRELSVKPNLRQKMKRRKHSEMPPCCQIHLKGLASVGEDVERNFRSFLLKIRNELLQQCYPVNLEVSLKHWQEIIQEVLNTRNNTRSIKYKK